MRKATGFAVLVSLAAIAALAAGQPWVKLGVGSLALPSWAELHALGRNSERRLSELIGHGLLRSPEMMLGLTIATLLPMLALASTLVRSLLRWRQRRERMRRLEQLRVGSRTVEEAGTAWLEFGGAEQPRALDMRREMIRIGRDGENEVRLDHLSVDHVHAIIKRTHDARYLVVDVSGSKIGLTVNGEPATVAPLRDGDRIGLGDLAVTFRRSDSTQPLLPSDQTQFDAAGGPLSASH